MKNNGTDNKQRYSRSAMDLLHLSKLRSSRKKVGAPPGMLMHVGEQKVEKPVISIIEYDTERFTETVVNSPEDCRRFKDTDTVSWINVDGLHDVGLIEEFGNLFDIHPLILEDILNTGQRTKIEENENHLFVVLKSLSYNAETDVMKEDQISAICGRNYVISFQERPSSLFKPVIDRIRNKRLKIRRRGSDYLTYALIDTVVDHNYTVLEVVGEKLELLDNVILDEVSQEHIQAVFDLKKKVFAMRKSIWPLREITGAVLKGEFELIEESTLIYYRDVNDHVLQIMEAVEVYRDIVGSMVDTYLSTLSLKMNQVMKVLTIAASIFMPLTFVAGIYGMNFKFMPELEWKYGYFTVMGVMLLLIVVMLIIFRRKKWL